MQDFKYLTKKEKEITFSEKRKKYFKIITICFAVILIIAGINYMYIYFKNKKFSFFNVKNIIVNGIENAPKKKIIKILNKYKNKSLTDIDLKKLYLNLKKIKWIDDVIIRKKYPSQLVVNIIEKKPVSILEINSNLYLIDSNGEIIDKYSNRFFSDKFVIFRASSIKKYNSNMKKFIPDILTTLKEENLLYNISEISLDKNYITMILTAPKLKAIVSPENFKNEVYKINILKRIKNLKQVQRAVMANIDFKDRIYLTNKRSK